MNKSFKIFAATLLAGFALTSCDTDVESVKIDEPGFAEHNAAAYQEYLSALRSYRSKDHKQVYAWFDNSAEETYSRYQHITDLPDSIDVVVLTNPENVTVEMVNEMVKVREEKGMKVIYDVDFDAIKTEYVAYTEAMAEDPEAGEVKAFGQFLMETMQTKFSYCEANLFDGIMIRYTGKATNHLNKEELNEYKYQEGIFMGIINDWTARHSDKFFAFCGKPQNVTNAALLDLCKILFVSEGFDAKGIDAWTYYLNLASVSSVPAEKLAMTVSCTSLSDDDVKTGWFSNGERAIASMGQWAAYAPVAGVGVANVSSDYFNNTYSYTRSMIQAVNPAGK